MPRRVIDRFEIRIYTRGERGHRPHVHARGNSGEIVVLLDPVSERENRGMKIGEARRTLRVIAEHSDALLEL